MTQAIQHASTAVAANVDEKSAYEIFEALVHNNDLSKMTKEQRIQYYKLVCELGLRHLIQEVVDNSIDEAREVLLDIHNSNKH